MCKLLYYLKLFFKVKLILKIKVLNPILRLIGDKFFYHIQKNFKFFFKFIYPSILQIFKFVKIRFNLCVNSNKHEEIFISNFFNFI